MEEEDRTTEDFIGTVSVSEYWRQVGKSEGFDVEDITLPGWSNGLMPCDCKRKNFPYKLLVEQYASLGIHRYNMLMGTNFEFSAISKFNMLQNAVSSFYITLVAQDPSSSPSEPKTFQVRIDEGRLNTLDLVCSIARLKDEATVKKSFIPHFHGGGVAADGIFEGDLPDWPSEDALNDNKRLHVLEESVWRATPWIRMYLKLVIYGNDRSLTDLPEMTMTNPLADLEILKVVIETGTEDAEPLKAGSANVYIMFKGLEEARATHRIFEPGKHVKRKAVVRRVLDYDSGYMSLEGTLCGGRYEDPPSWYKIKKRRRFPKA